MSSLIELKSLSLETARAIADAVIAQARARNLKMHVTVVDVAGNPLVYQRLPGAPLPAREFSEKKAYTALSFNKPTSAWKQRLAENPHLAAGLTRHPRVAMIGGGLPVVIDGHLVGAVGVAGGLEADDEAVVQAALDDVFGG